MPDTDLIARVIRYADEKGAPDTPFETGIDGVTIVRCRTPTRLEALCYSPLLCLVLQGRKESYLGHKRVTFAAGETLIVSIDLPTVSRVTKASAAEPYVAIALEIDVNIIRGIYDEVGEESISDAGAAALATGRADADLRGAMARLFDLVERPRERAVLLPLVLREVHFRILLARHGAMLRRLTRRDSEASRVARALAVIRKDYTKPLRVADLAVAAGMSVSSFHEHFKAVTATTPLRYQKDMRLIEARRMLADSDEPVSSVALDVGYESPNQFSREYARKFGRPPREDRAMLSATRAI